MARRLQDSFAHGSWLVDLATLSDPALIPAAIAAALRLLSAGAKPILEMVSAALAEKNVLLVLDNCEHLIDAAARTAEALLHAEGVCFLTTSREPLRAGGETVYRVPALATPEHGVTSAEEILRHGAVQLFTARIRAAEARSVVGATQVSSVADICRRLDGMPLAIELAASQAAVLGIQEVAAELDHRFHLLASGRRSVVPGTRPCGQRWTGATTCCDRSSAQCCIGSLHSRGGSRWKTRSPWPATSETWTSWRASWTWSPNRS